MTNSVPVFGGPNNDPRSRNQTIRLAPPLYGEGGVATIRMGTGLYADQATQSLELKLGSGLTWVSGSPYKLTLHHDGSLKVLDDGRVRVNITTAQVFDVSGTKRLSESIAMIERREAALEVYDANLDQRIETRRRRQGTALRQSRSSELRSRGLSVRGV